MADELFTNITQLGYYLNAIIIPFATALIGTKLLREKKAYGKFNIVRFIMFSIFLSFSVLVILELLINIPGLSIPFLEAIFSGNFESFSLYTLLISFIATLGMTMIAYANGWEMLYYSGLFFYTGMIVLYFLTGFNGIMMPYVYIAGGASIIFLYLTAFRVKDNGALGLAIFFTIVFGTVAIDITEITGISILIYDGFILIFSLGFFKPFKEEVVK